MQSSSPYDLALSGDGFFVIRTDSGPMYTRQGQFQLDPDGRLVTAQGLPVQAQGGGDIALKGRAKDATISIASDGSVLEDGEPIAKLDIVTFDPKAATYAQAGMFTAPDALVRSLDTPVVRQGMLEASNVSNADEMMTIMEAMRRAQAGQKLANLYDDLMGRALSVFGQSRHERGFTSTPPDCVRRSERSTSPPTTSRTSTPLGSNAPRPNSPRW